MNESIQNAVLGYTAKENRQDRLDEGTHVVTLAEFLVLNSRIQWDKDQKDSLPEFLDPTPQLGIKVSSPEGVAFHRFNTYGYMRWDELTEAKRADDKYEKCVFGQTVYACKRNAKGELTRIKDPKRTSDAESFLDQFMAALNMTGRTVGEGLPIAIAEKVEFSIDIEVEQYDGKDQYNVTNFSRVKSGAGAGDDFGE